MNAINNENTTTKWLKKKTCDPVFVYNSNIYSEFW